MIVLLLLVSSQNAIRSWNYWICHLNPDNDQNTYSDFLIKIGFAKKTSGKNIGTIHRSGIVIIYSIIIYILALWDWLGAGRLQQDEQHMFVINAMCLICCHNSKRSLSIQSASVTPTWMVWLFRAINGCNNSPPPNECIRYTRSLFSLKCSISTRVF